MLDKEVTERQLFRALDIWEQKLRNGKKTILALTDVDQFLFEPQLQGIVADDAFRIAADIDCLYDIVKASRDAAEENMIQCDPFYSPEDED